jgi:hypothetical protein
MLNYHPAAARNQPLFISSLLLLVIVMIGWLLFFIRSAAR